MVDVDTARRVLQSTADEYENDQSLEAMWAIKAYDHAEVYFNILCSVDPKLLQLTPVDDSIYSIFREEFPDMKIDVLNEDQMKSSAGKEKWRNFCERFKNIVDEYSFGTLIRINCAGDFSESNTMLVTRIQFYAIELARNREGFNDCIRSKFRTEKKHSDS